MSGIITQDWEPVVIRKKAPTAAAKKDEKVVNAARRAGAEIETVKKCNQIIRRRYQFHSFCLVPEGKMRLFSAIRDYPLVKGWIIDP